MRRILDDRISRTKNMIYILHNIIEGIDELKRGIGKDATKLFGKEYTPNSSISSTPILYYSFFFITTDIVSYCSYWYYYWLLLLLLLLLAIIIEYKHAWVNAEAMLQRCLVGFLVGE